MKQKVQEALNLVRPALQADGGDVELIDVTEDGIVKVDALAKKAHAA
jgi:Fe-S cluster biogenesis protein NfuA